MTAQKPVKINSSTGDFADFASTDFVAVTNGGTGTSSLTGHGAVVVNSGGTAQATVAPGSSGNVLTSNGTDWASTAPSSSAGFGGNGADGAITLTSNTAYTAPIQKNATTFSLTG